MADHSRTILKDRPEVGPRHRLPILGVIFLLVLSWTAWYFLRDEAFIQDGQEHRSVKAPPVNPSSSIPPSNPQLKKEVVLMPIAQIAATLNSPDTNAEQDLATLEMILREYRRQYQGNPSGENVEITAALMGKNVRSLGFIPKLGKNQINAQGELMDRWGSPYFFHVESSTEMEIRSAGQDGRFYSEDDVTLSPAAGE